jgi:hypothetical protein
MKLNFGLPKKSSVNFHNKTLLAPLHFSETLGGLYPKTKIRRNPQEVSKIREKKISRLTLLYFEFFH